MTDRPTWIPDTAERVGEFWVWPRAVGTPDADIAFDNADLHHNIDGWIDGDDVYINPRDGDDAVLPLPVLDRVREMWAEQLEVTG